MIENIAHARNHFSLEHSLSDVLTAAMHANSQHATSAAAASRPKPKIKFYIIGLAIGYVPARDATSAPKWREQRGRRQFITK